MEFISRLRALAAVGEIVENADAQIEAVQQHIEEHRQAQDQRPHRHEIEMIMARLPVPA